MGINLRDVPFKVAKVAHPLVIRLSGGRVGATLAGMPVVVVTTTGRQSGQPRPTPLTLIEDEGHTYIVASKGGDDRHPAWYLNLVANPEVTVQRDGRTETRTARVLSPEERAEVWPVVTRTFKGYAGYEKKTNRLIPVVELLPPAPAEA